MTKVVNVNSLSNADKVKLKKVIRELNDSLTRIEAEQEFQKETINKVSEDLGVDKKLIRRMAKVYFKANFKQEVEAHQTFEEFYEMVVNSKEDTVIVVDPKGE